MDRESTLALQRTLNEWLRGQGLPTIAEDGRYGRKTMAAYELMLLRSDAGGVGEPLPVPSADRPWWTSRAVCGALSGVIVGIAGLVGWSLDAEQLSALLVAIGTVASSALALYGSVRRKGGIDQTLVARFRGNELRVSARGLRRS